MFTTKTEEFFKKRAEIERDYGKKLQALIKTTEVERGSERERDLICSMPLTLFNRTLSTAWNTIKAETENLGKKHLVRSQFEENFFFFHGFHP